MFQGLSVNLLFEIFAYDYLICSKSSSLFSIGFSQISSSIVLGFSVSVRLLIAKILSNLLGLLSFWLGNKIEVAPVLVRPYKFVKYVVVLGFCLYNNVLFLVLFFSKFLSAIPLLYIGKTVPIFTC